MSLEFPNINCDLGEGGGRDDELMPFLQSCNIACGGHFGNAETIRETIRLAKKYEVVVGAHPSYPDPIHFGRRRMDLTNDALQKSLIEQITLFQKICAEENYPMDHIKLHGALYNEVNENIERAECVIDSLLKIPGNFSLYAPEKSIFTEKAKAHFPIVQEGFMDRRYTDSLGLVSRKEETALITDPKEVWKQFVQMLKEKSVTSDTGNRLPIEVQTFCIHGDTENAVDILWYLHSRLRQPQIRVLGRNTILLNWNTVINPTLHQIIIGYEKSILRRLSEFIQETVVTYSEIAIYLKENIALEEIEKELANIEPSIQDLNRQTSNTWSIPVCYDPKVGWDIERMVNQKELSFEEIIHIHTTPEYRLYFHGFLPGFMYLGGLDERLYTARKKTPRISVPSGAVGIGGHQTGIYPIVSPGGWQIIGRTPAILFDVNKKNPCPFSVGDKIKFTAISLKEFETYQKTLHE